MQEKHRKEMKIVGALTALFCLIGIVLVVLGFRDYAKTRSFVSVAASTSGEVTGFEKWEPEVSTSERDSILYAVVVFETGEGREVRFQGPSQDGLAKYEEGDKVDVLYDPENPEDARIDSFLGLWFGATMFWVIGGGAIVIPLFTLYQGWKGAKRQE